MSKYSFIQTIRYMGNKGKLLDSIIPEIESCCKPGEIICDIMSGTNAIGYALKERNSIITNDIQYYSFIIAKLMLGNNNLPPINEIHKDLDNNFYFNKLNMNYSFFYDQYSDTYFSSEQCLEIDSLRFAIEKVRNDFKKSYYLTLLMNAMCKAQSTTGHFAQYLKKENKRTINLRKLSIYDLFYDKVNDFKDFKISNFINYNFNLDYKELFKNEIMNEVKCFYLDSPYTSEQYSRFYHILETVCKYDFPDLEYKAKYRKDRSKSNFCYKNKVYNEFEYIISYCKCKKANLIISYSNNGMLSIDEIVELSKKYYKDVKIKNIDYNHSMQGKGLIKTQEVVIILKKGD